MRVAVAQPLMGPLLPLLQLQPEPPPRTRPALHLFPNPMWLQPGHQPSQLIPELLVLLLARMLVSLGQLHPQPLHGPPLWGHCK